MEFLSSLFQILNKPIHYLFIGVALIIWAPNDLKWIGYVLLMAAAATFVEWIIEKRKQEILQKKEKETKKNQDKKREQAYLRIYDELNDNEKYMVDSCIANNEYVYNVGIGGHDKHVTSLVLKGFGKSADFGREIVFSGDTFFSILKQKKQDIIDEWNAQYEDDEETVEIA